MRVMSNKRDNSSTMCYFGCDKCRDCIHNVCVRINGNYNVSCRLHRYEYSFWKRLFRKKKD